jgi:hypothetical protein
MDSLSRRYSVQARERSGGRIQAVQARAGGPIRVYDVATGERVASIETRGRDDYASDVYRALNDALRARDFDTLPTSI